MDKVTIASMKKWLKNYFWIDEKHSMPLVERTLNEWTDAQVAEKYVELKFNDKN
jgi:hypothetical protein